MLLFRAQMMDAPNCSPRAILQTKGYLELVAGCTVPMLDAGLLLLWWTQNVRNAARCCQAHCLIECQHAAGLH